MSGQIEFSVEGDQRKSHFPILFINFKSHVKTFSAASSVGAAAAAENASALLFREEALSTKAKRDLHKLLIQARLLGEISLVLQACVLQSKESIGLFLSDYIMVFNFLYFVFFQVQYIHYCWKHYEERLHRNF